MSVNKLLILISYNCMKKGFSQHQRARKISTVTLLNLFHFDYCYRLLQKVLTWYSCCCRLLQQVLTLVLLQVVADTIYLLFQVIAAGVDMV